MVDINGPFPALLPLLSFEGATKRNRPNLKAGDVVYARVAAASRDMEPVLTCVDAAGVSRSVRVGIHFWYFLYYQRFDCGYNEEVALW